MASQSPSRPQGILAIWNDCAPEAGGEFERWYREEHLPERLSIPGFQEGRRFEAVSADKRYFTFYEVDSPAVLTSPAYMERLNNPSPRTAAIMRYFRGLARTVCDIASDHGALTGAYAVTLRFADAAAKSANAAKIFAALESLGAIRVRVWVQSQQQTAPTKEAATRATPDEKIGSAIVIEALRAKDAEDIARRLAEEPLAAGAPIIGIYRLLCIAKSNP